MIGTRQITTLHVTGSFRLTVALACFLFDDSAWRRFVPRTLKRLLPTPQAPVPSVRRQRGMWVLAAPLLVVSALQMAFTMFPGITTGVWIVEALAPFRSINDYGLFASMTTERPVIEIEGTRECVSISFLTARPRLVATHCRGTILPRGRAARARLK